MNFKIFKNINQNSFHEIGDGYSSDNPLLANHQEFQERLRKTLHYGKYADATLPSPVVTDVAARFINARTCERKSFDQHQASKISRRARISPCALMMGILYTERLAQSNPSYLKKMSSSDLFVVSMLVASKYLYDDGEEEDAYNYDWCKAGNYHIRDLNRLEQEFLIAINWKIFVKCDEFFEVVNRLETRIAMDQGRNHGWYTYLDMSTILKNVDFQQFLFMYLKCTGKVILACSITYSVSIVLLVTAHALIASHHQFVNEHVETMLSRPVVGHSNHFKSLFGKATSAGKSWFGTNMKGLNVGESQVNDLALASKCIVKRDVCGKCGFRRTTVGSEGLSNMRPSFVKSHNKRNATTSLQMIASGFSQVWMFIERTFGKTSCLNRPIKFPIWENCRYSDIGFTTSPVIAIAA